MMQQDFLEKIRAKKVKFKLALNEIMIIDNRFIAFNSGSEKYSDMALTQG